jgi:hypothetical protein
MTEQQPPKSEDIDQPPPILGSWRALYVVLLVELALLTLAGYWLGRWAS